jgi:hypothetical protein
LSGFPDEESAGLLKELQVESVVVNEASYPDYPSAEAEILGLGLCRAIALEGEQVYTWCEEAGRG